MAYKRPDLTFVEFRGNVQTRLKKLNDGVADATFLAMAGLKRLQKLEIVTSAIETDEILPAVAQGAIGIERRYDDERVAFLLSKIHHNETRVRLKAERAFLKTLDGSCQTPIAGLAELDGGALTLRGEILRIDGSECVSGYRSGSPDDAQKMGDDLAKELLQKSAGGFF